MKVSDFVIKFLEEKLKLHQGWVKFYREHKWVKQENGRWKFVELTLTKVDS